MRTVIYVVLVVLLVLGAYTLGWMSPTLFGMLGGGWYGYAPLEGAPPRPLPTATAVATATVVPIPTVSQPTPAPLATATATTPAPPAEVVAYQHYQRGLDAMRAGDYDRAIHAFTLAIRHDPRLRAAYFARADVLVWHRSAENSAIDDYTFVIQLDRDGPDAVDAYVLRGGLYHVQGHHDRAIADFTAAIRLAPQDAEAYYNRGLVYQDQGHYELAIRDFDQAVTLAPHDPNAHYFRGAAYMFYGTEAADLDQAKQSFTAAIRHFDAGVPPRQARANLRRPTGTDRPAGVQFDLTWAYRHRAWAYFVTGAYALAIADASKGIEVGGLVHSDIYFVRGVAYAEQGRYDQARRDLEQAQQLGYDKAAVTEALARLPD